MANKYPYVHSAGPLVKTVKHLRSSFPKEVTAETLKKLGVAPQNESYVINVLRFLGVIDENGKKVESKAKPFFGDDKAFSDGFEQLVADAYGDLFELHADKAWDLDVSELTTFFRTSDHSSDVVGKRQATTFRALAGLSGHAELPAVKESKKATEKTKTVTKPKTTANSSQTPSNGGSDSRRQFGLTVRIEVNLPADGDQKTYDRIFESIRKNFIDA